MSWKVDCLFPIFRSSRSTPRSPVSYQRPIDNGIETYQSQFHLKLGFYCDSKWTTNCLNKINSFIVLALKHQAIPQKPFILLTEVPARLLGRPGRQLGLRRRRRTREPPS